VVCYISQRCTNSGRQVTRATKHCTLAPNICEFTVSSLLHITLWRLEIRHGLFNFGNFVEVPTSGRNLRPTFRRNTLLPFLEWKMGASILPKRRYCTYLPVYMASRPKISLSSIAFCFTIQCSNVGVFYKSFCAGKWIG